MHLLWQKSPETIYGTSFPGMIRALEGISQQRITAIQIRKPLSKGDQEKQSTGSNYQGERQSNRRAPAEVPWP